MLRSWRLFTTVLTSGFSLVAGGAVWAESPTPASAPAPSGAALYGALPTGEGLRLSPDGSNLAMISATGGRKVLVVWHLDGREPTLLRTADLEPGWLDWQSNRRLIAGLYGGVFDDSITPYEQTRSISFGVDGTHLTILYPNVDLDPRLNKMAALTTGDSSGSPIPTGPGGGGAMSAPPSGDDTVASLVFSTATRGSDQFQDNVVSIPSRDQEQVLLEAWLAKSGQGAVVATDARGKDSLVWEHQEAGAVHWMADSNGKVRLKVIIDKLERKIAVRDSEDGAWQVIQTTTLDKPGLSGPAVFAEPNLDRAHAFVPLAFSTTNPARLFVSFVQNNGYLAIGEYDIHAGQIAAVVAENATQDVTPIVRDNRFIGYRVGFGPAQYIDPNIAQLALSLRAALPDQDVDVLDASDDHKRVLVSAVHGNEPPVYWMLDRHGKKPVLAPALHPYEKIAADSVAHSQWIKYTARDGLPIPALLTLPVGYKSGALPFVVLLHDGPTAHDEPGYNWLTQFLASQGYGILQPQFRGSTGFGISLERAGDQEWGWKMQDDVTDGTQWLIHHGYAEAHRICVAGQGYGGYSALMGAVREPKLYRCVAALGPLTNVRTFVAGRADDGFYRDINIARIAKPDAERDVSQSAGATGTTSASDTTSELVVTSRKDPTPAELDKISPVFRAAEISVPVLLVHSRKDFVVPVAQSEELEQTLKKLGKPVQSLYFDVTDRSFDRTDDRVAFLNTLQNFLATNLGANNPS